MTFNFDQFKQDIQHVEKHQIRDLRQILRDEEARRDALPFIAERENEIAQEWQEANPPETDEDTGFPIWKMPTGAHDAWPIGAVVIYEGQQWVNTHHAPNAWEPGNPQHMWDQLTFPEPESDYPVWVQPTGAHDAYSPGVIVEHNGSLWQNVHTAGNSWEPGHLHHQWELVDG